MIWQSGIGDDSIANFVSAIAWPARWPSSILSGQPWIWLLAAYAAYWLGCRLALRLQEVENQLK